MNRPTAEGVSGVVLAAINVTMMVSVCAVHVFMRGLFLGRSPHFAHVQCKAQCHAGQRMVAVQNYLVVGDVCHGKEQGFIILAIIIRHAFKLHADLERCRQTVTRLDLDQRRIVFAEGVVWLDLDGRIEADLLAVERLLDLRQSVFIAAMQVDHRILAFFDQIALGIRQFVMHRHDRIFGNLHREFPFVVRWLDYNRRAMPAGYAVSGSGSIMQAVFQKRCLVAIAGRRRHTHRLDNQPAARCTATANSGVAGVMATRALRCRPAQQPIIRPMKKHTLLGGMTPAIFLRDYWQKKPLLVRQAIPGFTQLMSADDLFALAAREDVASRLVSRTARRWDMQHGPFAAMPGGSAARRDWTLLVQGVNLHHAGADALLRQFRFIPDSRLDDLMISYAADGGGVGPHFDSYDVFLLQAQGQRRWRISAQDDLTLVDGLPLKVLKNFTSEQEYILEPGDMLYLPPRYAHEGTAIGPCMTCSIGFRAPAFQELGEAFLQFMADSIDLPGRYADPGLKPTNQPAQLDTAMVSQVTQALQNVRFTDDDIAIFLGEYLSEPQGGVIFAPPARPQSGAAFGVSAARRGVRLDLKTKMLYRGQHVFINGESFAVERADRALLAALANVRSLDPASMARISGDVSEALHLWYRDGWLKLA